MTAIILTAPAPRLTPMADATFTIGDFTAIWMESAGTPWVVTYRPTGQIREFPSKAKAKAWMSQPGKALSVLWQQAVYDFNSTALPLEARLQAGVHADMVRAEMLARIWPGVWVIEVIEDEVRLPECERCGGRHDGRCFQTES